MTPRATYLRALHVAVLSLEPGAEVEEILGRAERFEAEALKRVDEIAHGEPEVVRERVGPAEALPDQAGEFPADGPADLKARILDAAAQMQARGDIITARAVAPLVGVSNVTASKWMNELIAEGLMSKAGYGPCTAWRLAATGGAAPRPAPAEPVAASGTELKEKVLGAAAAMQARGERVTGKAVAKALKVSPSKVSASMCALVDEGRMTKDGGGPYIVWRVVDGAGPSPVRDIGDPPPSDDARLYQRIHKTALEYQRAGKPVTAVKLADILGVGLDAVAAETRVLISHGAVMAVDWSDPRGSITVIRELDGSRVPSPGVRSPEWVRAGAER